MRLKLMVTDSKQKPVPSFQQERFYLPTVFSQDFEILKRYTVTDSFSSLMAMETEARSASEQEALKVANSSI